jgi:hypothetical protein
MHGSYPALLMNVWYHPKFSQQALQDPVLPKDGGPLCREPSRTGQPGMHADLTNCYYLQAPILFTQLSRVEPV